MSKLHKYCLDVPVQHSNSWDIILSRVTYMYNEVDWCNICASNSDTLVRCSGMMMRVDGIRSLRSRWMRWDEDASWCRHLLSRRSDAVKWSGAQVRSRDLQFLSRQARQSHSINLVTLILTAWPSRLLQALIIIIIIKVFLRLESALIEMLWSIFLPTLA